MDPSPPPHTHTRTHMTNKCDMHMYGIMCTRCYYVHGHLYRVQYIQEVILPTPSLFEENLLSALNSFILFNKSEIVKAIQVILNGLVFIRES